MKMQKINKNKQSNLKLDSHIKSNINIKQTESGRSMVEMLGVLAVIAVLSMGAYRGYYNSMVKERTNEVIDGGYKRAIMVSSQITMNQTITLNEFTNSNKVSGGTFDSAVTQYADKQQFGIKVSGVTKDVCDKIKESISDRTPLRVLKDTDGNDLTACTDNIDLMMVYNNNMKAGTESAGSGEEEASADPCSGFTATTCTTACTNNNGVAQYTYADTGSTCIEITDNQTAIYGTCEGQTCVSLDQPCNSTSPYMCTTKCYGFVPTECKTACKTDLNGTTLSAGYTIPTGDSCTLEGGESGVCNSSGECEDSPQCPDGILPTFNSPCASSCQTVNFLGQKGCYSTEEKARAACTEKCGAGCFYSSGNNIWGCD